MEQTNYTQLRAYAAQYGTIVGLMWIVSFAFFIAGLTQPLVGNASLLIGMVSVAIAGYLIRKFRHDVAAIRFRQAWWMSTQIFMYASLLMAIAQFVYFRFIDDGLLIRTYTEVMQQPEAAAMMQSMMPGEDVTAVVADVTAQLQQITPIQLTFEFLVYNLLLGFILSIPTAWIGIFGRKSDANTLKR